MTTTITKYVAASADDCGIRYTGSVWGFVGGSLSYPGLNIGYRSATLYKNGAGLRFLNTNIPKGSKINTSYVSLRASSAFTLDDCKAYIVGELVDGGTFSTVEDYQARRGTASGGATDNYRTVSQVDWTLPDTTAGNWFNSPDISAILQEIVNANAIQNLVLWIDDHDGRSTATLNTYRDAATYDANPLYAPILHVNFTSSITPSTQKTARIMLAMHG